MKRGNVTFVAGILLAVLVAFWVWKLNGAKEWAQSRNCASTVVSLTLAARVWADDNNGVCARDFQSMSNEVNSTRILVCPADKGREPAGNWSALSPENCSYEILLPGCNSTETNAPYLRCNVHGHLGYLDGTVFDGKRRRGKND